MIILGSLETLAMAERRCENKGKRKRRREEVKGKRG